MKTIFNQLSILNKSVFFGLLLVTGTTFGQQLYYSQYQLTPMLNNPSMITLSEELKVDVGYRSQFGGKGANYATPVLSASMPFYNKISSDAYKKYGAAGLQVFTDRTGFSGMLATSGFSFAYSHIVRLSQSDWISFGLQPGIYQRRVDFSRLTSGSQWDGSNGVFINDPSRLGENINADERRTFFTINSGATYVRHDNRGREFLVIGLGANNLTRPNISLNANSFSNPVNWNFQGSVIAFENTEFQVKPTFRHIQSRNLNQTNVGSYFYYKIEDQKSFIGKGKIGLGLWYSNQNAIITALEINQKDWSLGFSYDFLASTLADANNSTGAPEIVIGFRKYIGKGRKGSADINASGSLGGGGSGGGKLKDLKKAVPVDSEISQEPVAKPVEAVKEAETPKPEPDKDAVAVKKESVKPVLDESAKNNPPPVVPQKAIVQSKKATKRPTLKSNLSPGMTEKLSKVLTPDEELGKDPYAGTPLALTKKQREIFRKQPRYGKGGYELDEVAKGQMNQIVKILKSRPKLKLEINGFCCDMGGPEVNKLVSAARAENVKRYFRSKGIPLNRLKVKGNGLDKPIGDNTTEEGRITNRRVQFKFVN
jgi:type IX secretion system PorP/SprF family membrane protein